LLLQNYGIELYDSHFWETKNAAGIIQIPAAFDILFFSCLALI